MLDEKVVRIYTKASLRVFRGDVSGAELYCSALEVLGQAIENIPNLKNILNNPAVETPKRLSLLTTANATLISGNIGGNNTGEKFNRFIEILFLRGRLNLIPQIALELKKGINKIKGIVEVQVTSAFDLNEIDKSEIVAKVMPLIKGQGNYSWHLNNALIGGFVAEFSGQVLDCSLLGKLTNIESNIL